MKTNFRTKAITGILLGITVSLVFLFSSCSDNSVVYPRVENTGSNQNTAINLKLNRNAADNPPSLSIDDAKFLLKKVEFELEGSENEYEVELGPKVVSIDLSGALKQISSGVLPAGVYNKVKFEIHKAEDNESISDPEFKEGTQGFSFIIKGKYNGKSFVYRAKRSISIIIIFDTPITIQEIQHYITMIIDGNSWFTANGTILDPADPGKENEIDDSITNSFGRAFKDDDHNGVPDPH